MPVFGDLSANTSTPLAREYRSPGSAVRPSAAAQALRPSLPPRGASGSRSARWCESCTNALHCQASGVRSPISIRLSSPDKRVEKSINCVMGVQKPSSQSAFVSSALPSGNLPD